MNDKQVSERDYNDLLELIRGKKPHSGLKDAVLFHIGILKKHYSTLNVFLETVKELENYISSLDDKLAKLDVNELPVFTVKEKNEKESKKSRDRNAKSEDKTEDESNKITEKEETFISNEDKDKDNSVKAKRLGRPPSIKNNE